MDVVQAVLAIAPVPYLQTSFTLLASIHKSIQQAKTNKLQLRMLSDLAARLLKVLNDHIQAGKISPSGASTSLADLERCASKAGARSAVSNLCCWSGCWKKSAVLRKKDGRRVFEGPAH
jgi:hypothetical protein